MKTGFKHCFRWLESTPWAETPLCLGRAQKPEEQTKYDAAMASKNGLSKTIYALLDGFGGLSKIYKAVVVGIAVLVILFFAGAFTNTKLQKPLTAPIPANLPPQSVIDNWKADENKIPLVIGVRDGGGEVESTTIDKIEYGSQLESWGKWNFCRDGALSSSNAYFAGKKPRTEV